MANPVATQMERISSLHGYWISEEADMANRRKYNTFLLFTHGGWLNRSSSLLVREHCPRRVMSCTTSSKETWEPLKSECRASMSTLYLLVSTFERVLPNEGKRNQWEVTEIQKYFKWKNLSFKKYYFSIQSHWLSLTLKRKEKQKIAERPSPLQ